MEIDIEQLVNKLVTDLQALAKDEWTAISSFAAQQSLSIATQAQMIATSRTAGSLRDNDALFNHFVEQLKTLAENFARTLAALTILTLEKAWNLIVGAVWGAINGALGSFGLPPLHLPGAPPA